MKLLSYILLFLFIIIYYYNTNLYEHYDTIRYDNDIFQSIINPYNPYLQLFIDPYNILKDKCYYKLYDNSTILIYVNNILKSVKISNISLTSNLLLIQRNYIIGFMSETSKVAKKTNYLYHYYNKIINLNTFINLLNNYLTVKTYDNMMWILLCYKIFFDYNLFNGNYNDILLIANYVLEEMKKFAVSIFLIDSNSDLNIKSSIYIIKNRIFYNDNGNYFINNNIFDCKNI